MKWMSKLKIKKSGVTAFSVFYAIAGGTEIFILFLSGFRLFTLGFLGVLSLASAYSLVRMKKWSVWLVIIRFFLGTTFGATTLYASIRIQTFNPEPIVLSFHLMLMAYLTVTVIGPIYVLAKRGSFH